MLDIKYRQKKIYSCTQTYTHSSTHTNARIVITKQNENNAENRSRQYFPSLILFPLNF